MEQAGQGFHWALLTIPALLLIVPAFLFYAGHRASRMQLISFTSKSLYWLGGHGITLVIVATLTKLQDAVVPVMVVSQLPLIITAAYILLGFTFRSPFVFSLGLATPGLWMFFIKAWEAFSENPFTLYKLPQDPFWYLLAAALLFGLQYLSKPKEFWEEMGATLVTISCSYLMGSLWLLALGQPSLLAALGIPLYIWAVGLFLVSVFLLWCAKFLRDPLFAACSVIGIAAGVYTFITRYPWPA